MKNEIVKSMAMMAALAGAVVAWPSMAAAQGRGASTGGGFLKTKVEPGRAGVFVDGKYVGPAANFGMGRKYSLPEGRHEIRLTEPRYEEVTRTVEIHHGKTTTISERLTPRPLAKPPFGRLRVVGFDKYAAVYVNGRFCGHADEFSNFAQGLLLNPGPYSVRVAPSDGRAPHEERISIETNRIALVRAR